jgi:type II restriction enzyme
MEANFVVRHQLSTNDPNTYYRLHPDFERLLHLPEGPERDLLLGKLQLTERRRSARIIDSSLEVQVRLGNSNYHVLSPGRHNVLEKSIVEILSPALVKQYQVVYLGDTAPRIGYQNRSLMRRLNLPIDLKVALPDVIVFGEDGKELLVVEAVESTGPITSGRLNQLTDLTRGTSDLGVRVSYITAFPSRRLMRKFLEEIAWGSSVWIEDEPSNIIHFAHLQ